MLVKIGEKAKASETLVDLLLACHERIRSFAALARAAGERPDAAPVEVAEVCSRVERYFTEALPLHVRDEEETLIPRLEGRSPEVDRALLAMKEQHGAHEQALAALFQALSEVRRDPTAADKRAELGKVAAALEHAFAEHLALEETVIFPALRMWVTGPVENQMIEELRRRRVPK